MAIDPTYTVTCDICGLHYDDTRVNEDEMSLYSRIRDAGWRQKHIGDMPVLTCPSCRERHSDKSTTGEEENTQ